MRLWSLHPSALDRQGLIACWREALLAQAVLLGRTQGYTRHPQLERFRSHEEPPAAVGAYLAGVHAESLARGYRFDAGRIVHPPEPAEAGDPLGGVAVNGVTLSAVTRIEVTLGQLEFERNHLLAKLTVRSPELVRAGSSNMSTGALGADPAVHPLFAPVPGQIEAWERG